MRRDRELERALDELPIPGEDEAGRRARELVLAAHAGREPQPRSPRRRRFALLALGGAAALAIGLSPAGAKVGDVLSDVFAPDRGADDARPALRSLPAAGELLVESRDGPWVVRADGSKRLLGDYDEATWSPHGLFVAVTDGRELAAVEPDGDVRWTVTAPGRVQDPRWSPSGFRIAYRSGEDLRVVAGDGTGDRLVAREVAPRAPAWRPLGRRTVGSGGVGGHLLAYGQNEGRVRTVDVDSGRQATVTRGDLERLTTPASGLGAGGASSPTASTLALIRERHRRSELVLLARAGRPRTLFSAPGRLTGPTWSPNGRWLLVGWPAADQWLFIPIDRPSRVVAFDRISEQFDPGGDGAGRFPRVAGWILPRR